MNSREKNYAIEADQITKEYGGRPVLGPISFKVKKNSIHGLLGPNGAGKSTTFKILSGLLNPNSGAVYINGSPTLNHWNDFKNIIGISPETPPFIEDLSVEEYLLYSLELRKISKLKRIELLNEVINELSLKEVQKRLLGHLSTGYKKRVSMALGIIHKPEIIILDEPTAGLDPQSVIEIRNLLLKLKKNHTVLLSSHILHEVEMICDEVTIIESGKIKYSGSARSEENKSEKYNIIEVHSSNLSLDLLNQKASLKVSSYSQENNGHFLFVLKEGDWTRPQLIKFLIDDGIEVEEFKEVKENLENLYLKIIGASHD